MAARIELWLPRAVIGQDDLLLVTDRGGGDVIPGFEFPDTNYKQVLDVFDRATVHGRETVESEKFTAKQPNLIMSGQ